MSLFVGNISKNVRSKDLQEAFDKYGKCELNIKVQLYSSPLSLHVLFQNLSAMSLVIPRRPVDPILLS